MTKVTKIQLVSKNDDILDYKEVNKILWDLQRETRNAANRAIQLNWENTKTTEKWKEANGEYPTNDELKEIYGKSLSGYIYDCIKKDAPTMNTGNLSAVNQKASAAYKTALKEMLRGDKSMISFKKDMPLELAKKSIVLSCNVDENNGGVKEWIVTLSLLSNSGKAKYGLKTGSLDFKAIVPAKAAGSVRAILERCYDGVYSIAGSQLKYVNGKWYLLLCYSFDKTAESGVAAGNVMGVHIAQHNAITCSFSNSKRQYHIDGGEVLSFTIQIERRRRNIGMATSKNSVLVGGGRVGHGYKKKLQPLDHISDKIANFRNTTNHRYSRQIVNWAVSHKCGTIQIEDLSGFAGEDIERYTLLKNWSYFDLISKIEYKAKEHGIKVVKIGYKGLWKWCPDCAASTIERIKDDEGNEQAVCTCCGQVFDADRDIPKALIIESIDKVIKEQEKNDEQTAEKEEG